ncbi:hypothetical protein EGW08_003360, partial [Elysia chlorotica]
MDMRFWNRGSLMATSDPVPVESPEKPADKSYTMSVTKQLENAFGTVVSAITTPIKNLKSLLKKTESLTIDSYADLILLVLAAFALFAIVRIYRKTLRSVLLKSYRKVHGFKELYNKDDYSVHGSDDAFDDDEDDDDDDDEDEEDEESEDSDYSRGDRSTKKYCRARK